MIEKKLSEAHKVRKLFYFSIFDLFINSLPDTGTLDLRKLLNAISAKFHWQCHINFVYTIIVLLIF